MDLSSRREKSGMKPNRVNFDFEEALYRNDPLYKSKKIVNKLEYIYFLFNEEAPLYSEQKYSKRIIKYYLDLFHHNIQVEYNVPYNSWWGDIEDFEESKRINSKVEQTKYLNKVSLIPKDIITVNELEIVKVNPSLEYYYRSNYGFSGLANSIISKRSQFTPPRDGVLGQYRDVILSFGVTFRENDFFICKNIIEKGKFLGGEIITINELTKLSFMDHESIEYEIKQIIKSIKTFSMKDWGQFDSFFYKEGSEVKWYKVVEINQRKTMGLVVKKCQNLFGKGSLSFAEKSTRDIPLFHKDQAGLKFFYSPK